MSLESRAPSPRRIEGISAEEAEAENKQAEMETAAPSSVPEGPPGLKKRRAKPAEKRAGRR